MAVLKPPQLRPDAPNSERELFRALSTLDDEWCVYAHVVWQSKRNGREGDGEIDFVLLHPRAGVLVLEVKGGGISIRDGQWLSTGRQGTHAIKNPFEQVVTGKYALIRFLAELGLPYVPVNHAVCFPDASDAGQLGTYGAPAVTWWRSDLRNIDVALQRTIRHWSPSCRLTRDQIKQVDELLAPTTVFRRRLVDDIGEIQETLLQLTQEQLRLFDSIQRNRRAVVMGGPGSGKTLLSIARARRLKQEGFNVLWTCYNELLAKVVADQLRSDGIEARTFHSLCMKEIHAANLDLPAHLDERFWVDDAPALLLEAAVRNGTSYDAVIIDEGQDFSQPWIDALEVLISDAKDAPLYVFADSQQRLYPRTWAVTACTELDLPINCRNSKPIAGRVSGIFDDPIQAYGAPGLEPVFSELSDVKKALDRIEARIGQLVEQEGLRADQVTVLSDDDALCRKLRERYAGPHPFTEHGKSGVVVETIHRFKGLENDVIVVVFAKGTSYSEDEVRRLAYVGFSRARAFLLIIGDRRLKAHLNW